MDLNFATLHHDFLSYIGSEKGLTSNSIAAYGNDIKAFLNFCTERNFNTIQAINEKIIVDFLEFLRTSGYMYSSIHRKLIAIKVFFRFLKREAVIHTNPTQFLASPKLWQLIPEVLTQEEIDLLLAQPDTSSFEGCRDLAIIEVLYGSGLRVSELCSLQINSIDAGTLRVMGKGRKERIIPIGRKALEAVDDFLNRFRDATADLNHQTLFVTKKGKSFNRILVWKMIKERAKAAGILKNISPHTLRHSFATHLVDHGAELRVIQEMLGHSSISSTDRYTHISRNHLQEAFQAFHPRR